MHKFYCNMTKLACFIYVFAFFWGCDNQAEPPKSATVVSKKIIAQQPSAPATPKPAPMVQPAAKPAQPEQQPPPADKPKKSVATPRIVQVVKQAAKPEARISSDKPAPATKEKAASPPSEASEPPTDASDRKPVTVSYLLTGLYDPSGKIDPFLPLYKEEPVTKAKDKDKKKKIRRLPMTPLEKVDLSQLKLVGVIRASSGNRALVEEATGKGYIVKEGTYIGINAGRVIEILKDRLIVEEEVETVLGSYELQKRELKIQKPPGEM